MTEQADKLRAHVNQALKTLGMQPAKLSREIGKGKDYLRDFLEGKKASISADALSLINDLVAAAQKSDISPSKEKEKPHVAEVALPAHSPELILGDLDLKVYRSVQGGEGVMVVYTDPIDVVQRPWFLRRVKDGYAVVVTGDSMEPVYDVGDMAIVNPALPPLRGKDAIFISGESVGEFCAAIKRFVRETPTHWVVRQFNPPKDFELLKAEWPKALRVVGRYTGS